MCLDAVAVRRIVLLCVLPALLGAAPQAQGDLPLLIGTDGPGFTIDLTDANGKHVDVLTAGQYTLLVHDLSDLHNFALGSQTTNTRIVTTGIEFVGDETYTLDLTPGRYAYACSAHFDTMNGRFVVVAAPAKTLSASVTARGTSLSAKSVTAGTYKLTVSDRSRTRNFHLVGPGVNRRTSKKFTGKATWQVALSAGVYRFGSDPRLAGRLAVSAGG